MSSVSSAGVTAALPFLSVHGHAHRKGSPVPAGSGTDALTGADSAADASAPATNQGIFSSLLQTAEKLVGVQLTAPTAVPTKSPVSAGTPGAPVAPLATLPSASAPLASTLPLPVSDPAVLPVATSAPIQTAPVDPSATAVDKSGALNPGLALALSKLQLLTASGQASAAQTAAVRRIDTTA